MEALSVQDYRKNLATAFDRSFAGERVLIRRKNQLYALICVGKEDVQLTESMERNIESLRQSVQRSWNEVKEIEAGNMVGQSALDFIDEL